MPVRLVYIYPEQLNNSNVTQIVVHEIENRAVSPRRFLRLKQNGASIVNHLEWCGGIAEISSLFLDVKDILKHFTVSYGTLQTELNVLEILQWLLCYCWLLPHCWTRSLIKLCDGGPIFYSQIRTGLANQPLKSGNLGQCELMLSWTEHSGYPF